MNENNRVEYKLELNPDVDIEKEVIAFLNYKEGGFIYIGIDKGISMLMLENYRSGLIWKLTNQNPYIKKAFELLEIC